MPKRRFPRQWAVSAIIAAIALSNGVSASTTSGRHGREQSTLDQPDVVNPVYSHIPASEAIPSGDASATAEQLLALFIDRHTAMDYAAAAEAALRLIQAAPDRPHGYYNLACALTRLRRLEEAVAALSQAVDAGWRDVRHMSIDPDLVPLRSLDAFKRIGERIANQMEADRLAPLPLRSGDWAAVREDLKARGPKLLAESHVPFAVVAVVHEGELAGILNLSADGTATEVRPSDPRLCFRVRRPIELLGLIAGAQLQQRGQLMLAELIEQGADLDREFKSRANQNQNRRPAPVIITPVAGSERSSDSPHRSEPALRIDPNNATLSLLKLSIEMATGEEFGEHCRRHIFEPMEMQDAAFSRLELTASEVQIVSGQTYLGTAVPMENTADGPSKASVMYVSAEDLAKIIMLMISADSSRGDVTQKGLNPDPIAILARVNSMAPGGAGLGVQVRQTEFGRRVQILEIGEGVGCLMRWYPRHGSGVVILFNAECGGNAALRLAHIALGGE
jgi:hypothetical protein